MKNLVKIAMLIIPLSVSAQSNVGIGTDSPASSAQLDIFSNNKGLLIPRIALTSMVAPTPISAPVEGLIIWNTNEDLVGGSGKGFYYWEGSQWQILANTNSAWSLTGNVVDTTINFIGTTNSEGLMFRVGNQKAGGIFLSGENLFLGWNAGQFLKYDGNSFEGERNTFLGANAGRSETNGRYNTFVGARTGYGSNGSFGNVFLGTNAGAGNTSGYYNIGIGVGSGYTGTGSRNIGIGANTSGVFGGTDNIMIGHDVGSFIQGGNSNVYIGSRAATGNFGLSPKADSYDNVVIGDSAVYRINGATANVIIGKRAGYSSSQGNFNVFVGDSAGINNITGDQNTYLGSKAKGSASSLQNATAIGANSFVSASNSIVIGSVQGQNGATEHINVGIGTTAPQYGLHVVTNDAQNFGYRQCIMVENVATGSGNTGEAAISFKNQGPDGTGNSQWMIGLNQTRNLSFAYGADFAGGSITKMYLDSLGRLGIGTTAPQFPLHVGNGNISPINASNTRAVVSDNDNGQRSAFLALARESGGIRVEAQMEANGSNGSGPSVIMGAASAHPLYIRTGNFTRMTIDEFGNVGIGTTAPNQKLDVNGNVELTGKMVRPSTSSTDLLPFCYGYVSSNGIAVNGTGNYSVVHTGTGVYDITLTGQTYSANDFMVSVTPVSSIARMSSAGEFAGKLVVRMFNSAGTNTDIGFFFFVYKP